MRTQIIEHIIAELKVVPEHLKVHKKEMKNDSINTWSTLKLLQLSSSKCQDNMSLHAQKWSDISGFWSDIS